MGIVLVALAFFLTPGANVHHSTLDLRRRALPAGPSNQRQQLVSSDSGLSRGFHYCRMQSESGSHNDWTLHFQTRSNLYTLWLSTSSDE